MPDVQTFLTLIGRGLGQHASKFPSWESLFSVTSQQLKELGIDPPRTRKYLIRWRQRFRLGLYGVGGDLQYVQDGRADLQILEAILDDPVHPVKYVVNVPPGQSVKDTPARDLTRPRGYRVQGATAVVGPYALPSKGGGATVMVTEGMWEDKQGRKIDGGERRRAEVRHRRGVAERKERREREMAELQH